MKFNTDDKSFVRVATRGGEIMMVVTARDGPVPRYDLQDIHGTGYANIGEYELTLATEEELEVALSNFYKRDSDAQASE